MRRVSGSFRDPSGQVFYDGDSIIRTINKCYEPHWNFATKVHFFKKFIEKKKILFYEEVTPFSEAWKCLRVEKIPFITYPYEWCFSQLKDAALLTLELQIEALEQGMILKDSSAYNVQFCGASPIFIDLLSFERWKEGIPWVAYKQFCTHFLAPLSLICKTDVQCGPMSRLWIDGIPLPIASKLLPVKTILSFGLLWHLHLHAKMQIRHADRSKFSQSVNNLKVSMATLSGIAKSLQKTIQRLQLTHTKTEWGTYYENTNYTDAATLAKMNYVEAIASKLPKNGNTRLAVDLGANTGRYSQCLSPFFDYVIAPDIDHLAVERHYNFLKSHNNRKILPMVIDLSNLSPGLGWASAERESFLSRCKADMIVALALVHHLVITAGVPLFLVAELLSDLLKQNGCLLIEFVPKDDSQVQLMLSTRKDIFSNYSFLHFQEVFSKNFVIEEIIPIPESVRILCVMKKR